MKIRGWGGVVCNRKYSSQLNQEGLKQRKLESRPQKTVEKVFEIEEEEKNHITVEVSQMLRGNAK